MPTEVFMPELGESVDEATVTRWLKAEGEAVEEFEPLLEVNTDKVDTEIPSPASGTLLKILIPEETVVSAGQILCWIGESGEDLPDSEVPLGVKELATSEVKSGDLEVSEKEEQIHIQIVRPGRYEGLGYISPVVAKMAQEYQIDLAQVKGTGKEGRITKKDIQAYLDARPTQLASEVPESVITETKAPMPVVSAPHPKAPPVATTIPGDLIPHTTIRKAIAEHMVRSKHTSPHVTTVMEADLSRVIAHRAKNKDSFARDAVRLTFTAYFVSAMVTAVKAFPLVNTSWSDDGIIVHKEINVGMATALEEDGLIVPVIKNADGLSLLGIARAVNDLAERARNQQLRPDEVRGGTITLTNHGTSGSLFAAPIINQPQCAILGAGVIQKRVVVIDDAIAIRPMVYLSLTFDHRILDGATADYYLHNVVEALQNWAN